MPVEAFLWHANSGNAGELATSLPMIPNATKRVIYSIPLPDLAVGDLVQAWATFEVTNPYQFNVMVGRSLLIGATADAITGTEISEPATRNITPGNHHDHIQDFGSYRAPIALTGKFLNLIAYAGSSQAVAGDEAVVEQDYGRLFVNIFDAAALKP